MLYFIIYENEFPFQYTNSLFIIQTDPLLVPIIIKVLKVIKRIDTLYFIKSAKYYRDADLRLWKLV